MKLLLRICLALGIVSIAFSQQEIVKFEDKGFSKSLTVTVHTIVDGKPRATTIDYGKAVDNYLKEKRYIYQNVYGEKTYDDFDKAKTIGWNNFNSNYSRTGISMGFMEEALGAGALEGSNQAMGHIGNSLALMQIGTDLYKGDRFNAMSNTAKTSMFYVIGTYGWKALKVSSYGMQVLDLMLTELGNYAVSRKYENLRDPYFAFYSGRSEDGNAPKRSLSEWKTLFEAAEGEAGIKKVIDDWLELFFDADAAMKKTNERHYMKKDMEAVKKEYYESQLLPYLRPVFSRMAYEARQEKIVDMYRKHKAIIRKVNKKNKVRIMVNAEPEIIANSQLAIQVVGKDGKRLFVKGKPDTSGKCVLSFTKYSLHVHEIKKARVVLRVKNGEKYRYVYKNIDPKQDRTDVVLDYDTNDLDEDEEREDTVSEAEPEEEEAPESHPEPEQPEIRPELKNNMKAVLTINGGPLNVSIVDVRESAGVYTARIKHKRFPAKNTLTVNKLTGAMTLVYKLKGAFAPELICRSPIGVDGNYAGLIVTNNDAAVKVGAFLLQLK